MAADERYSGYNHRDTTVLGKLRFRFGVAITIPLRPQSLNPFPEPSTPSPSEAPNPRLSNPEP